MKARIKRAEQILRVTAAPPEEILLHLHFIASKDEPARAGICYHINGPGGNNNISWERDPGGSPRFTIDGKQANKCPVKCDGKSCKGRK